MVQMVFYGSRMRRQEPEQMLRHQTPEYRYNAKMKGDREEEEMGQRHRERASECYIAAAAIA